MIPFNQPYLTGKETEYLIKAVASKKISGNGLYTKKCHTFFQDTYGFGKCLLTSSCTDALEMSALLVGIQLGDEVIMPTYTFVSTANAFILRGAEVKFADSGKDHPNIDPKSIERLITERTKAIVIVHYAGMACDIEAILAICEKHGLYLIEDAAQAIDATYKGKPLGSFGDLSTFSFHETKNIIAGEGGLLVVNNPELADRAEIIWEKGTNRSAFSRGEINKYGWVDVGSSFLPSEVTAAFLYAQLENLKDIQRRRLEIWTTYQEQLEPLEDSGEILLPKVPHGSSNNAHVFYLLTKSVVERDELIAFLRSKEVHAVFHYLCLHKSEFYLKEHLLVNLPNAVGFEDRLVRLPLFYELKDSEVDYICEMIRSYFQ
ncbi:dTDP-4-amino-4,6-dideoxygalactose transaminase [Reichenbachiella sp. MSK19-1]|uniref:dTDP-4-amino-4,6-dideoxygalactose transaminase n=1 Tax=Reichenbachiella sp. MSK19-1 TaxID=1897631 RepID=UPI001627C52D|nr:dTDP-4-amino-4,6-dideoxygalactose transaminase [Reichenbachiella sp. MSK19-1]